MMKKEPDEDYLEGRIISEEMSIDIVEKPSASEAKKPKPVQTKQAGIPAKQTGTPEEENDTDDFGRLRGDLNSIRSYCQDLRDSCHNLKSIVAGKRVPPDEYKTTREYEKFLYDYSEDKDLIEPILKSVETRIRVNDVIADLYSDQIADIRCGWNDILYAMDIFTKAKPEKFMDLVKEIDDLLCNMIVLCEQVTLPNRLNLHLDNMRIGQKMVFYDSFKDEICSKTDATFLLDFMSKQPDAIKGLIDTEAGVIYKASPKRSRQWLTYIAALVLIAAGGLLTYLLSPFLLSLLPGLAKAGTVTWTTLFVAYVGVILGGCIHILIDIVKENQSAASKSRVSVTDWFVWGHINELSLFIGIFMLWFCFIGIVWINQLDFVTSVAVGYSFDSVFDLFVARFDKGVTTRTAEISNLIKS